MKNLSKNKSTIFIIHLIATLAILVIFYQIFLMRNNVNSLTKDLLKTKNELLTLSTTTNNRLTTNEQRILELSDLLYEEQKRTKDLQYDFNRQVGKLNSTVDNLEKLTTTDPELLQKYSSIYFLNENYKPSDLTKIDEKWDYPNGKEVTIHSRVWPFLKDLLEDAKKDRIDIQILSGYRSFKEQKTLKGRYMATYGTGANKFSADQGYSEHQLGTTVDFTTPATGEDLDKFDTTKAHIWLENNAYKYGFILSYPKGNEYYEYEPWHWRFVGKDLARYLHKKNKHFYELEQRKIDSYIPNLFDK